MTRSWAARAGESDRPRRLALAWQAYPSAREPVAAVTYDRGGAGTGRDNGARIRLFDGSEHRVLERPSGPGDPVIMEFRLPDRCAEPLTHVHPHNVEVFEVLRGEVELLFGSEWRTIRASESVTVPPGSDTRSGNHSGKFAAFRNVHDPHHDFEAYLRKLTTLQNESR